MPTYAESFDATTAAVVCELLPKIKIVSVLRLSYLYGYDLYVMLTFQRELEITWLCSSQC